MMGISYFWTRVGLAGDVVSEVEVIQTADRNNKIFQQTCVSYLKIWVRTLGNPS